LSIRRVVITGLGAVTPLANNVADTWDGVINGKSGIGSIDSFDISPFATTFGGVIKNFDISEYIPVKDAKRMDGFIHYGIAAGCQAIDDSGIEVTEENAERIGVAIGAGIGGITGIEECYATYEKSGPRRISPFFVPGNIINMIAGNISIKYGLKGPNFAIVTACSTGTHNIGDAARLIKYGDADVMIAGGADASLNPVSLAGIDILGALTHETDPAKASRPFDLNRDGFVYGEGAGIVVLENYEHAKKRGAPILAELAGTGWSFDAYDSTAPVPGPEAHAMRTAMKTAGVKIEEIDYVNAHGTSTKLNDACETTAIKMVLGDHAYKIPVSSTKSMIGHLITAAGVVETIASILIMTKGIIHPTINYETPDKECDLDYVPNIARKAQVNVCLKDSFGLGGENCCLVLRRLNE